jgi:hypothetical protein
VKIRATWDLEVIEPWRASVAAYSKQPRPELWVATASGLTASACLIVMHWLPWLGPIAIVTVAVTVILLGVSQLSARAALKCPHCGEPPVRGRRFTEAVEFCEHCYYWLDPPFGPGSDEAGCSS